MADDFNDRLRAWRKSRFANQKEAAAELGIDQSYLSKLERGTRAPSYELLQRLRAYDGPGAAMEVQDQASPRYDARRFVRPAPEGVVIHKSLTFPGDTFVYDRDAGPDDGDWVLASVADEPMSEARVAAHPVDGTLTCWFLDGRSHPLDDAIVQAVAVEWRRPLKPS